jgi:hypothetical protein
MYVGLETCMRLESHSLSPSGLFVVVMLSPIRYLLVVCRRHRLSSFESYSALVVVVSWLVTAAVAVLVAVHRRGTCSLIVNNNY